MVPARTAPNFPNDIWRLYAVGLFFGREENGQARFVNIGDGAFFDDFGLVLGALKSRSALFLKGDDLGGDGVGDWCVSGASWVDCHSKPK